MTTGILALWNDCAPDQREIYESWYQGEHLVERLEVPGIRRGRRYETVTDGPEFFTYYETDAPEVLTSAAYITRLNDPSALTRRIMSGVFMNMSRTVCRVVARHGEVRGAWAATLRLPDAAAAAEVGPLLAALAARPCVARAEAWVSVGESDESIESRLRGGDDSIAACLFVETLREADARAALAEISADRPGQPGVHRLLCERTSADLRT